MISFTLSWCLLTFLADRTDSRACGTMLSLSVCLSVVLCNVWIVAKWCVLEQKLPVWQPIGSCIWGIDWYQIEWTFLRGHLRSCQQLCHVCHWTWLLCHQQQWRQWQTQICFTEYLNPLQKKILWTLKQVMFQLTMMLWSVMVAHWSSHWH